MVIFKMYKQYVKRSYDTENISFLVAGTLMILITSLFVNAGAQLTLDVTVSDPNKIVMNTVISSATAGLITALTSQQNNIINDLRGKVLKQEDKYKNL
jgi:ammonia channel protein AmtB